MRDNAQSHCSWSDGQISMASQTEDEDPHYEVRWIKRASLWETVPKEHVVKSFFQKIGEYEQWQSNETEKGSN